MKVTLFVVEATYGKSINWLVGSIGLARSLSIFGHVDWLFSSGASVGWRIGLSAILLTLLKFFGFAAGCHPGVGRSFPGPGLVQTMGSVLPSITWSAFLCEGESASINTIYWATIKKYNQRLLIKVKFNQSRFVNHEKRKKRDFKLCTVWNQKRSACLR